MDCPSTELALLVEPIPAAAQQHVWQGNNLLQLRCPYDYKGRASIADLRHWGVSSGHHRPEALECMSAHVCCALVYVAREHFIAAQVSNDLDEGLGPNSSAASAARAAAEAEANAKVSAGFMSKQAAFERQWSQN
eukprot:382287-Pelagomonas_calceolata.AAC.3